MRTRNSIRNIYVALIGQILGILLQFISRRVFVEMMNENLLGANSVFANILSILSLAELGIGSAVTFTLYKPLADKDQTKIAAIMRFYKQIYRIVACGVFLLGIVIAQFLPYIIKEQIPQLHLYYYLYLASSVISYLCAYKRTLIIADQKSYISSIFRYSYIIMLNVTQIVILYATQNFALYLIAQIILSFAENILISLCADHMYPYMTAIKSKLSGLEKYEIWKNIRALFLHKIGSVVVTNTDSILLSMLVNLRAAVIYTNYKLIFSGLNSILTQLNSSISASVGNLLVERDVDYNYKIYRTMLMLFYWIYGVTSICLITLLNDLITVWLGKAYIGTLYYVLILVVHFYISGIREPTIMFKNALGLFWNDRYKSLIEAVFNIVLSIMLGIKFGSNGIFGATILSALLIPFWVEPYVLYKHYWNKNLREYFAIVSKYSTLQLCIGGLSVPLSWSFTVTSWPQLIIKSALAFIFVNVLFIAMIYRTSEFRFIKSKARDYVKTFLK